MLTKQEREATIERIKSYGDSDLPFYKLLFGSRAPYAMQYTEYLKALKDRVIDLCDTSNMIELPLDKDGEVIHIHDVVYDDTGMEWEVRELRLPFNGSCIYAHTDDDYATFRPDELTHKATTTITENIEAFNEAVKVTAQYVEASMNECVEAMKKLAEAFNRVGGSDD